jgi:hypothetical protein
MGGRKPCCRAKGGGVRGREEAMLSHAVNWAEAPKLRLGGSKQRTDGLARWLGHCSTSTSACGQRQRAAGSTHPSTSSSSSGAVSSSTSTVQPRGMVTFWPATGLASTPVTLRVPAQVAGSDQSSTPSLHTHPRHGTCRLAGRCIRLGKRLPAARSRPPRTCQQAAHLYEAAPPPSCPQPASGQARTPYVMVASLGPARKMLRVRTGQCSSVCECALQTRLPANASGVGRGAAPC